MTGTASHPLPAEAWELAAEWLPPNDDPERPQVTLSTSTSTAHRTPAPCC